MQRTCKYIKGLVVYRRFVNALIGVWVFVFSYCGNNFPPYKISIIKDASRISTGVRNTYRGVKRFSRSTTGTHNTYISVTSCRHCNAFVQVFVAHQIDVFVLPAFDCLGCWGSFAVCRDAASKVVAVLECIRVRVASCRHFITVIGVVRCTYAFVCRAMDLLGRWLYCICSGGLRTVWCDASMAAGLFVILRDCWHMHHTWCKQSTL